MLPVYSPPSDLKGEEAMNENANARDDAVKREALLRDLADRLHSANNRMQVVIGLWSLYRKQFLPCPARDQLDVAIARLCGEQSSVDSLQSSKQSSVDSLQSSARKETGKT